MPAPPTIDASPLTPGVRTQLSSLTAEFAVRPSDAAANLNLARALVAYEIYDAAQQYLRRASTLDPGNVESVYLLGWVQSVTGNHEAAVASFDRVLAMRPDHPQAMLRRADALRRIDRFAEAEQAYRQMLTVYPDQPNARFGLGSALLGLGRLAEARQSLESVTGAYSKFGAAHYTLAQVYRQLGEADLAQRHLAAYQGNRTSEPQFDDEVLDRIKEMDRSHQGLYRRSLVLGAKGDWAGAAALLEEAVREDQTFLVGHVNLITCYAQLGDLAKVDEHYRRALALSPESAELQNTRGIVANVMGRPAEARAHFLEAIKTDPNHYTSFENLGRQSYDAGDRAAALRYYDKAASIAPYSTIAWTMVGTIHLEAGRVREAQEAFLQVVRPGPDGEAVVGSIKSAYEAARQGPAWTAFAVAAIDRARRAGMARVEARLRELQE